MRNEINVKYEPEQAKCIDYLTAYEFRRRSKATKQAPKHNITKMTTEMKST